MQKLMMLFSVIIFILAFSNCKKSALDANGLPPATQSGANTLGFLLNGKPWLPNGYNGGDNNLAINVDFGYKNGGFSIGAYNIATNLHQSFIIGIADSLKFFTFPKSFTLDSSSLFGIAYDNYKCSYFSNRSSTISKGSLTVSKLDKSKGIISGTFYATLWNPGYACDTIKITDGRFDMSF